MMTATTLSSSHSSHDLIEYETRSRSSSTGVSVGRLLVNWFWEGERRERDRRDGKSERRWERKSEGEGRRQKHRE